MSDRAYGEDEDSEVTNLDKIRSIGLLKETIAWNPDDNYDDISALVMLMIMREDRLQFKNRLARKQIADVTSDSFFGRHLGDSGKSYSNRNIMDFIKTEHIKS